MAGIFLLGEIEVTLSELESERIEELRYRDPRVRFALFRGTQSSLSCKRKHFEGETLDRDLNTIVEKSARIGAVFQDRAQLGQFQPLFFWYKSEIGDFTTWLKKFGKTVKGGCHFREVATCESCSRIRHHPFEKHALKVFLCSEFCLSVSPSREFVGILHVANVA